MSENNLKIINHKKTGNRYVFENIFVVHIVPSDGLVLLGARTYAGIVLTPLLPLDKMAFHRLIKI